jgi:hypothetical protein
MNTPEEHRHQCEVRWCIRHGAPWFQEYIKGVKKERGEQAAQRLWSDVKEQAQLGNTGQAHEWIEKETA